MTARVLLTLLALLLAGCAQPEPETPAAAQTPLDDERPPPAFGDVVTGPAAGPDLDATLDAPPRLIAGEWWQLRFETPLSGTDVTDVIRVVAAVEPDGYVFGLPHEGWAKEVVGYHSPALGDVGLDLSYAVHNEVFQPLKFPLTQGASWDTVFGGTSYHAQVESVDGVRASVVLTPQGEPGPADAAFALAGFAAPPIRVVYDASMHEIVRYESGLGTYEVVEHGYDFAGWVTVPRAAHTAIDHAQVGPLDPARLPGPQRLEIAGGYNRMTLLQGIFPLAPGVYMVRAIAPDGTEMLTEATDKVAFRFHEFADPDGTWTTEDLIVGAGVAFSMGIAYHQYDIRLPDGARRADHSHAVVR